MNIVFRTDASQQIGSGHVMRCLTLAKELHSNCEKISFITREHKSNLNELIIDKGFDLTSMPLQNVLQNNLENYEKWLGVTQEIDAEETIKIVKNQKINWLIIDHYALDSIWEKKLRFYVENIMVIDDLANRTHDCDIILDQNLFNNMQERYKDKTPEKCIKLFGPQYAILGSDYYNFHKKIKARSLPIENILIFFSSLDLQNLTSMTLSVLEKIGATFKSIEVVISKKSPNYIEVLNKVSKLTGANIYSDVPTLATLIKKADLAIGAGGSTNWERLCLGLPTIVVTIADNQQISNQNLHQKGLIKLIGSADIVGIDDIASAVKEVIYCNNYDIWSKNCMQVCSGNGTSILSDFILKKHSELL